MVLSHGQSAAERGFSAIKNHLVENLHEKSIQYQRMVIGYMKSNGYNSYDVPIGQKLIKSVKGSQVCGMKRERIAGNFNWKHIVTKPKEDILESTVADLKKDSEFRYKAEHETKLISVKQLVSKSNVLRRAVVEKQEELNERFNENQRLVEKKKDFQIYVSNW